jgi:hypothetical protein
MGRSILEFQTICPQGRLPGCDLFRRSFDELNAFGMAVLPFVNRPRSSEAPLFEEWSYEEATQIFPEVIERAVRMVGEAGSQ